ncbi:uncharacterized protein LOC143030305 [Oratosquilla oratoria]|uniref:uncharacterized protein LOC143030305 n=1 Tax=Oratosquilla oratoria TaxID=337810 RepID=UPI003F773772
MLEQVQQRVTRLVQGLSHLSYPERRLASLQLPTLQFCRLRTDVIQTFKILKNIDNINYTKECSTYGKAMFKPARNTATRGHNLNVQIHHQPGPRKGCLPARVSEVWNRLLQHTVNATSLETFKTRLAKEWENRSDLYQYSFLY